MTNLTGCDGPQQRGVRFERMTELPQPPQSLVAAEQEAQRAQPLLFEAMPEARENLNCTARANRKEYTAEWLFKYRRKDYDAIVTALSEGFGIRQICRALHVSHHTVELVRLRESSLVATLKKGTVEKLRTFVRLASDRLIDEVYDMKLESLPVAIGILTEKAQLLDGEATARVEEHRVVTHRDYEDMVRTYEAEAVETGLSEEKNSAKETLALASPDVAVGIPSAPPVMEAQLVAEVAVDNQSSVSRGNSDSATVSATENSPDGPNPEAPSQAHTPGGGGVTPEGAGPSKGIDR